MGASLGASLWVASRVDRYPVAGDIEMSDSSPLLGSVIETPVAIEHPVYGPEAFEIDLAPVFTDGGLRVLLRSEVKEEWLSDRVSMRTDDEGMTVVTRPLSRAGLSAMAPAVGARLRVFGADGQTCLARITGAVALGRMDAGDALDPTAGARGAWETAAETHVVAGDLEPLEGTCRGALWARSEALPLPGRATTGEAAPDLRRAAVRALKARPEYRELTDGSGAEEFQVNTLSVGGEKLVVTTFLAEGCAGQAPALIAFWERDEGGALQFLGAETSITEVLAAVDADGDGNLELLARDDLLGAAVLRRDGGHFAVAERAPVSILGCRC